MAAVKALFAFETEDTINIFSEQMEYPIEQISTAKVVKILQ